MKRICPFAYLEEIDSSFDDKKRHAQRLLISVHRKGTDRNLQVNLGGFGFELQSASVARHIALAKTYIPFFRSAAEGLWDKLEEEFGKIDGERPEILVPIVEGRLEVDFTPNFIQIGKSCTYLTYIYPDGRRYLHGGLVRAFIATLQGRQKALGKEQFRALLVEPKRPKFYTEDQFRLDLNTASEIGETIRAFKEEFYALESGLVMRSKIRAAELQQLPAPP